MKEISNTKKYLEADINVLLANCQEKQIQEPLLNQIHSLENEFLFLKETKLKLEEDFKENISGKFYIEEKEKEQDLFEKDIDLRKTENEQIESEILDLEKEIRELKTIFNQHTYEDRNINQKQFAQIKTFEDESNLLND